MLYLLNQDSLKSIETILIVYKDIFFCSFLVTAWSISVWVLYLLKDPMEGKSRSVGIAPFASVEDLSEPEPEPEPERLTLPGVKEEGGSGNRSPKMGVPTPRIDISRASSSSHQDDSSPERDLFTGEQKLQYFPT